MSQEPVDRRTNDRKTDTRNEALSEIVLQGLVIQRRDGNASAIEYMKNNNVPEHVIERVASGAMRLDDAFMLAAFAHESAE